MNAGTDYTVAKTQAQANAALIGKPRWLHQYQGSWWISDTEVASGEKIDPAPQVAVVATTPPPTTFTPTTTAEQQLSTTDASLIPGLPPMVKVASSNISAIGFKPGGGASTGFGELVVEFTNGGLYTYPGVSAEDHQALMTAESKGKAFAVFKKRYTVHHRIDKPEPQAP